MDTELDTELVYETPLFMGQKICLHAVIWLIKSIKVYIFRIPPFCDLLLGNT